MTKKAIRDGADEIDYVLNIEELKMGNLAADSGGCAGKKQIGKKGIIVF